MQELTVTEFVVNLVHCFSQTLALLNCILVSKKINGLLLITAPQDASVMRVWAVCIDCS